MLLGYIDQMFASGFAYRGTGGLLPEGLLQGKAAVCVSMMKGPSHYPLLWLNNANKVLMRRALLRYVGIKQVKFFEFGNMEKRGGKQVQRLQAIYRFFQRYAGPAKPARLRMLCRNV